MGDNVIDVVDSMNMQLRQLRLERGGEDAEPLGTRGVPGRLMIRVEEDSCGCQDDTKYGHFSLPLTKKKGPA